MPKIRDPLVSALLEGSSYVYKVADGGDLASMREALKHGQIITFSPIARLSEILVGDIVIVRWRGSNFMMHLVAEIQDQNYLIVNSLGKVNGWVTAGDIIGRANKIVDPPPRPPVLEMIAQLKENYCALIEAVDLTDELKIRLLSIQEDLAWYASRLVDDRWSELPRQNLWSFESHVWHLLKEVSTDLEKEELKPLGYYLDHGKEHVGEVAKAAQLFNGYR